MRTISDWTKKAIGFSIASLGYWHIAIGDVHAQLGNIVVYIAGDNPAALNIARQVVTNPIVALVNGKTSIVAGSFDAPTADFVTKELQKRGVTPQQGYTQATKNPSDIILPSYLPKDTSVNSLENSAQYRYVTAVPVRSAETLAMVRQFVAGAFISKSFRGDYIYAGGYTNLDGAESLQYFLRSRGLDARVLYF
jgi:hypothetical protein